ncbi:MAG: glycosyltransferase [Abditibacteriales bacterium]|nr:glycosyltransferase [Abditibacteriales bacterium]
MKILLLTPDIPFPPYGGGQLRCFHVVKELAARHEVFLVGINRCKEPEGISEIANYCAAVRAVRPYEPRYQPPRLAALRSLHWRLHELRRAPEPFRWAYSPEIVSLIQRVLREWKPDVIQVESTMMAQSLLQMQRASSPLRALMMYDVVAQIERQKIALVQSWRERWKRWLDWQKAMAMEKRICHAFDLCFTMSEADRATVRQWYGRADVLVSPNGVDVQLYQPLPPLAANAKPEILFTGYMAYTPNHDGAQWFCRDILPLIHRQMPEAHFTIMGRSPKPEVAALASERVTVTGEVPDALPYFRRAAVCVVPLRMGSGTRLKILEAFALGKAVVSTTVGAEGLEVVPGQHLLIADDPPSFAAAVVRVLRDADLRERLGRAGRELVEQRYDWRQIVREIERVYETALQLNVGTLARWNVETLER